MKISFILNDETIETDLNPAEVVLDFIRSKRITGTKEGCREGDCGACTVLIGEIYNGKLILGLPIPAFYLLAIFHTNTL